MGQQGVTSGLFNKISGFNYDFGEKLAIFNTNISGVDLKNYCTAKDLNDLSRKNHRND
jgi:hypothetical protein